MSSIMQFRESFAFEFADGLSDTRVIGAADDKRLLKTSEPFYMSGKPVDGNIERTRYSSPVIFLRRTNVNNDGSLTESRLY